MRVLSIDFDYFIKASDHIKSFYFPDGGLEMSSFLNKLVWSRTYTTARLNGDDLVKEITVRMPELKKINQIIKTQAMPFCMVADSHMHAYAFIKELADAILGGEDIEVYNIDHHHDTFKTQDDDINCGNWLRKLLSEKIVKKAYWVNNSDSELGGNKAEIISLKDLPLTDYDIIYVCRSSWWTPPHLDDTFIKYLATPLTKNKKGWYCKYAKDIRVTRYDKAFLEAISETAEIMARLSKQAQD